MDAKTEALVDALYRVPEDGKAEIAEAEPALPGWSMSVADIFP